MNMSTNMRIIASTTSAAMNTSTNIITNMRMSAAVNTASVIGTSMRTPAAAGITTDTVTATPAAADTSTVDTRKAKNARC